MADHFPFKLTRKAIIAVIGLPYTFRKEMGKYISNWAKCPNLTFEVILKALPNSNLRKESDSSSSSEEEDKEGGVVNINDPSDVAFNILCETAVSLLNCYQPNCVVINFPIPTIPQLEKLISLHDHKSGPRLLIIECQRRSKFRWRQAVEDPSRSIWWNRRYDTGRTRPGKWEDVEKAIQKHRQQQQGLDATLASHNVYVKKLVVDPFQDLRSRDFTDEEGLDTRSLFSQAIKDYLSCDDHVYEELRVNLDYYVRRREWLKQQADSSRRGTGTSTAGDLLWLCEPGNCIFRFTNNLIGDPICDACEEKVTEGQGAYYCQLCRLSLHQPCAVAQSATTANSSRLTRSEVLLNYSFADASELFPNEDESRHINDACYSCKREGNPFSRRCNGCVYKAHLKAQLLPTAFNHSCDKHHFLSLRLSRWSHSLFNTDSAYDCKACGLKGALSSYSCNICNSEYHLDCVLQMPLQTNGNPEEHGGHTHNMEMQFRCGEKEYEYEWCPVCYNDIDPDTWVYTCQHSDCDFVAHLYCIFPSQTFHLYKILTEWK